MAEKDVVDGKLAQPNNPLTKKLSKILETRIDNEKDMLESLKALSTFFKENNLRSRRNLRGDIERRSLAINEDFLEAFRSVKEELDEVYTNVQAMNVCCQDMTNRLKSAKDQTHDLINQTTSLQGESQKLQMKSQVAEVFLAKFQLKSGEVKVLTGSREGALHPDFFKALARVGQIHNDCKMLLRTNQQTAGLEIMESMALHQESAYERLYRWTQNECRSLSGDSPDISSQLCMSLQALQDRPVLLRYSLDEFGTSRRNALVRGFIDALTRGGPGGTPRPIELHSHDPLRYVGDMLAWLHQATASEKEHLQTLLKNCNTESQEEYIQDILGHITEGVCRPLKVRVEQVLVAEPGVVLLYKLTNLIQFYKNTVSQLLSNGSSLAVTLDELHDLGLRMFFNSLTCHMNKVLEKVELPTPDLGPTSSLSQSLQLLQDVLSSHDSSVVTLDDRKDDFTKILQCVVEPLMQMCSVSASKLNTVDMATYMVNSIYLMQTTLALYEFTDHRLEMLQAQIDAHLDTMVNEQASYVLTRSGLAQIYNIVQLYQPKDGPLSAIAGTDPQTLKAAMSQFDNYLASPDTLVLSQCSLLISASLRGKVKTLSAELLCMAYRQIYEAVQRLNSGYKEPQSIAPRTPDQVKELLKI